MALTLSIGMALGCLISLITFFLTINHSTNNKKEFNDGSYDLEIKSGNRWVSAEVKIKKKQTNKQENRFHVKA